MAARKTKKPARRGKVVCTGLRAGAEYAGATEIATAFGFSRSTFARLKQRNTDFPRPIKISQKLLYNIQEMRAWFESKRVE